MVFAGSSYDKRALLAIRLDGAADSHRYGSRRLDPFAGTPYVPSPLLYDDGLYFLSHYQGILYECSMPPQAKTVLARSGFQGSEMFTRRPSPLPAASTLPALMEPPSSSLRSA